MANQELDELKDAIKHDRKKRIDVKKREKNMASHFQPTESTASHIRPQIKNVKQIPNQSLTPT